VALASFGAAKLVERVTTSLDLMGVEVELVPIRR
jgi:hypothetical protein